MKTIYIAIPLLIIIGFFLVVTLNGLGLLIGVMLAVILGLVCGEIDSNL